MIFTQEMKSTPSEVIIFDYLITMAPVRALVAGHPYIMIPIWPFLVESQLLVVVAQFLGYGLELHSSEERHSKDRVSEI